MEILSKSVEETDKVAEDFLTTLENLKSAAEWENEEWTELYPSFAKTAREEWFTETKLDWFLYCSEALFLFLSFVYYLFFLFVTVYF
mgnify:CR=1 FL=1